MKKRVYLDFASAAPMEKGVLKAMEPHLTSQYGNPGAKHTEGREAKEALEKARTDVADILKVKKEEIIFTSGATEANTLAIVGHIEGLKKKGYTYKDMHVVTSAIEHVNVLKSVEALKDKGVHVSVVFPNEEGIITPQAVAKEVTDRTALVSIQYVNSEIGTIMPLHKIRKAVQEKNPNAVLHSDGAQAAYFLPVLLEQVGADLLSLDGQKFGGPRGIGVLVRKRNVALAPILFGGSQEQGMRPGTENVALAVGFAFALTKAQEVYEDRAHEITILRNWTLHEIEKEVQGVVINGSTIERIANNINISIPGKDTEYLAVLLDQKGFAVSTKITCEGGSGSGSNVVRIVSNDEARALSTLRITLGPETTKKDMQAFVRALAESVQFLDQNAI